MSPGNNKSNQETKLTSTLNLANLLSQAPIAMAVYRGPNYIIELANSAMCRFWDKTEQEVLERPLFEVLPEAEAQGFKTIIDRVYQTGERFVVNEIPVELPYKGQKQTLYYTLLFEALRNEQGEINGIMGLAHEVSEQVAIRKKIEASEKKYRSFIDNNAVATAIYEGRDMVIAMANQAKLNSWRKGPEVIGKKFTDALPEMAHQPFLKILQHVYDTGEEYLAPEDKAEVLINDRLETIYVTIIYRALKDEEGNIYGILNSTIDVTPLVSARKELEEAEEKKRLALEAGSYGIWDYDLINRSVELDNRCRELYCIPKDKTIQPSDFLNYVNESDHEKIREASLQSLDPEIRSEYNVEFRVCDESTKVRWLRSKGKAYFDGAIPYRFVGTCQDITAEKTMRDEQTKLLKLVDNSIELMSLLKLDNKNSYLNKAGMELLGFDTFEQMLETSISDLHDPEDFEKVSAEVLTSLVEKGRWSGEMKVRNLKTGEIIPVYNNTVRINDAETGEIMGFGAVMRDMRPELQAQKELKENALLFKQYVSGLPVAFYTVDTDGTIVLYNEAAVTLWGRTPIIGKDKYCGAEKLLRADGSPIQNNQSLMIKTLKTKQAYIGEAIVVRPDGEHRYVLSYPQPMFNTDGALTGAMNVVVDITERKKTENALLESEANYKRLNNELEERIEHRTEDLKAANLSLKRSNADLEQFAYVASHDLQEPLRKIQIFSDLMINNSDDVEFVKKQVAKIDAAAKRMSTLVKDLLNYSRLSSADQAFASVDLNEVLNSIQMDLEMMINDKKAVINYKDLPIVPGIPLQLYQLFLNLINNSLKFTETTPQITITSEVLMGSEIENEEQLQADKKYAHITFSDNGIGFDESFADRIFTIFQRLNNANKFSGTGIGLAICKKVIENHGGEISVRSAVGKGSTFHIYLPVK